MSRINKKYSSSSGRRNGSVQAVVGSILLLALLGSAAFAADTVTATEPAAATDWRSIWSVSPSNATGSTALDTNDTVRQIIHVSAAGSTLRIRLTQRYGTSPVGLADVSIGKRAQDADIVPGSLTPVTFGGSRAVTIAAGQEVTSDPVAFPVDAFDDLVVSFAGSTGTPLMTEHFVAREWPYFASGTNLVDQTGETGFVKSSLNNYDSFFLIEAVDTQQSPATRTLVAVGDSITDGFISEYGNSAIGDPSRNGLDERYPDFLALRLSTQYPDAYSVVNAGIAGNKVLATGTLAVDGPSLLTRLSQDVLAVPGITDVILLEGTNDLAANTSNATSGSSQIIAGLKQAISRMKTAKLRVLLGTITPRDYSGATNGAVIEKGRQIVNAWIRKQTLTNGVVDFDACLKDPNAPSQLNPSYDSGDHLHPNQIGYSAMANCVNLALLKP